jgi:hypothetical protein
MLMGMLRRFSERADVLREEGDPYGVDHEHEHDYDRGEHE